MNVTIKQKKPKPPKLAVHKMGLLYISEDLPSKMPIKVYAASDEKGKVTVICDPPVFANPGLLSELDRAFLPVLRGRIQGKLAMQAQWDQQDRQMRQQMLRNDAKLGRGQYVSKNAV